MKKKQSPEQYTARPKTLPVKAAVSAHPAFAVAKVLVSWLVRGGTPPSIILLHGLYLARSAEHDGTAADSLRPLLKMQGDDNRVISEILNVLARPQADKIALIAAWLQANWVNKSARPAPTLKREAPGSPKKPLKRMPQNASTSKPVIVIKAKKLLGTDDKESSTK